MHHFCVPRGLRRRGGQPLSRLRDARAAARRERPAAQGLRGAEELHQGDRQGHPEGDVQDGHLDLPVLLRRADLRRRRPVIRASSRSISPAPPPPSKARAWQRDRRGDACAATRDAYGDKPIYRNMLDVGGDYAFRLRGEDHAWTPDNVGQAAARGARQLVGRVQGVRQLDQRAERAAADHPRPDGVQVGRQADPARRGRARGRDRQALRHRRDELRLDQPRGAHHARHRHEPHRRQVEHRRGRRGDRSLQAAAQRRFHALGHQAGGVGPLRRHRRVPGQCRRPPDQDGAGRQARRGRPAARPQGRQEHRARAPLDAGRRPDLAAAAPRHLFDRGSGAAHPRPQERQPEGAHLGEAGLRGRRRHGRRGRQPRRAPTM